MPSLIASDGLEYADILQRVAGNPLENERNASIQRPRAAGYCESEVRAFWQGHDRGRGRPSDKNNSGWRALDEERARSNRAPAKR